MKKYLALFLAVCLLAALAIPASAAAETVILKDLKLSVVVPDRYLVITQDTDREDPVFEKFNVEADAMLKQFRENKIYLNAVPAKGNEEIVVTMDKNTSQDFDRMSDSELMGLSSAIEKEYEKAGAKMTGYKLYEHPQLKFVELSFENPGNSDHALQFYTVHDHRAMNFTYHSYKGPVTEDQEKIIRDFVDSVTLLEKPMAYEDPVSGTVITVPAGWMRDAAMEDRDFPLAFMPIEDTSVSLLFSGDDVYKGLSSDVKKKMRRSEADTSLFTPEDAADMFSVEESAVKKVTYNQRDYYTARRNLDFGEDGQELLYTVHQYICVDNGWLYFFQLAEPENAGFEKDLESVLENVAFPR